MRTTHFSDDENQPRPVSRLLKVGGALVEDEVSLDGLVQYVVRTAAAPTVIVHGGGDELGALHRAMDVPFEKIDGVRVTRGRSLDLATMVLRGLVSTRIVGHLCSRGLIALGVSGVDVGSMRSPWLDVDRFGRVGGPPVVDAARVHDLLSRVDVLVVSPICVGPDGAPVNVNADHVALALATSLGVSRLDLATDVDGVLIERLAVERMSTERAARLIDDGVVTGGMVAKLRAACQATREGVPDVRIGSFHSLAAGGATRIGAAGVGASGRGGTAGRTPAARSVEAIS